MSIIAWIIFAAAAILEVSGDASIRKGLRSHSLAFIISGLILLGCYGLVVNMVKWDFSKLLGVYVAAFALVSILFGHFLFHEAIPIATWLGLALIVGGGLVIQFGSH